jgi:hypothetical protein
LAGLILAGCISCLPSLTVGDRELQLVAGFGWLLEQELQPSSSQPSMAHGDGTRDD